MSTSPPSIDVYVAPMRPYTSPDQLGEGEVATWAPVSSTLISGPTEGILIDALLTFENADRIAAWANSFGKTIAGVYITHGHSDHWLGLARLLQHFPEVRGYAAPEVVRRAAWEAEFNKTSKYRTSRVPGELPETPVVPEVLNLDELPVDRQVVKLIHVCQGDIDGSTIFHVPSADAVVCGDVVYNNIHMMMYEANEAKREAWIASIDAVAALNAKIVVAGHKSVRAADRPENLTASQGYLRDFTTLAKKGRHGGGLAPRHARIAWRARPATHSMDLRPSRSRLTSMNRNEPWTDNHTNLYAADLAAFVADIDLCDALHVGHSTGGGGVARRVGCHATRYAELLAFIKAA